ncbi:hypothetical protein IG193_00450 [Infirmifilum lucidum]|uniref:Uncharacterized protein n=2 Tax=Infirmifilum lucidum TaxID=2776706 RepID=A0A7L9FH55_9CREN|nr:hypothetical protein IG193_00450 [Infirmifilum lucidum]
MDRIKEYVEASELLKKYVDSHIGRCPLCGGRIICDDRWCDGHVPYIYVDDEVIKIGFYCRGEDEHVILFEEKRGRGGGEEMITRSHH